MEPPLPHESLPAFLDRTVRAASRGELMRHFSSATLSRAVAAGSIVRLLPGFYASALHSRSFQVRVEAAVRWSGGTVWGPSALYLWEILDDAPRQVHIEMPQSARLRGPDWLVVRRPARLSPAVDRAGIKLATVAYAVVHGYGKANRQERGDIVFRAVRDRHVTTSELERVVAASPRILLRRGLVRSLDAVARGAHSPLEERAMRRVFNTAEFVGLIRQHEVVVEGHPFRLDMYDASTRTAIESDGVRFHWTRVKWRAAIERDALLATVGIQTVRMSGRDLEERPDWCRAVAFAVLEARARRT